MRIMVTVLIIRISIIRISISIISISTCRINSSSCIAISISSNSMSLSSYWISDAWSNDCVIVSRNWISKVLLTVHSRLGTCVSNPCWVGCWISISIGWTIASVGWIRIWNIAVIISIWITRRIARRVSIACSSCIGVRIVITVVGSLRHV